MADTDHRLLLLHPDDNVLVLRSAVPAAFGLDRGEADQDQASERVGVRVLVEEQRARARRLLFGESVFEQFVDERGGEACAAVQPRFGLDLAEL